jgi:cytochrome c-type biogenesis protein
MKNGVQLRVLLIGITLSGFVVLPSLASAANTLNTPAPDFTATNSTGQVFSLHDLKGRVVILHFTGLESPVCLECLEEMKGQIQELQQLAASPENVSIITINLRKNPSSMPGWEMAEQEFNTNVSWHWVEDFSPYPIASLYQQYWTVNGAFANPTLVLIDANQSIVGVYHVYCLGRGTLDGIQTHDSLARDVRAIASGTWEGTSTASNSDELTLVGMLFLGILTSVTPCSIALLVAMISYIGTLQKDPDSGKKYHLQGLWIGIVFTLGMSLVFFVFGMVLSSIGSLLQLSAVFYLIAGIVLVLLGLNIFKPFRELLPRRPESSREARFLEKGQGLFLKLSAKSIYIGAFVLGVLFSIGWAPCALSLMMPVFILTLTQKISIIMGGVFLFVFGLGHGIPIIPLCATTNTIRGKLGNRYVSAGRWMQWIFGVIIIVTGVIMAMRYWGVTFW